MVIRIRLEQSLLSQPSQLLLSLPSLPYSLAPPGIESDRIYSPSPHLPSNSSETYQCHERAAPTLIKGGVNTYIMGKEDKDSRSGGGRGADNYEEAVVDEINSPSSEELLKQEEQHNGDDEHVTLSSRPNVVSTHHHSTSDTVVSAITTPHGLLGDDHRAQQLMMASHQLLLRLLKQHTRGWTPDTYRQQASSLRLLRPMMMMSWKRVLLAVWTLLMMLLLLHHRRRRLLLQQNAKENNTYDASTNNTYNGEWWAWYKGGDWWWRDAYQLLLLSLRHRKGTIALLDGGGRGDAVTTEDDPAIFEDRVPSRPGCNSRIEKCLVQLVRSGISILSICPCSRMMTRWLLVPIYMQPLHMDVGVLVLTSQRMVVHGPRSGSVLIVEDNDVKSPEITYVIEPSICVYQAELKVPKFCEARWYCYGINTITLSFNIGIVSK